MGAHYCPVLVDMVFSLNAFIVKPLQRLNLLKSVGNGGSSVHLFPPLGCNLGLKTELWDPQTALPAPTQGYIHRCDKVYMH